MRASEQAYTTMHLYLLCAKLKSTAVLNKASVNIVPQLVMHANKVLFHAAR